MLRDHIVDATPPKRHCHDFERDSHMLSIWCTTCIQMHSNEVHMEFIVQSDTCSSYVCQTDTSFRGNHLTECWAHVIHICLITDLSTYLSSHLSDNTCVQFQQHSHFMTNFGFLTLFLNTFCRGVPLHCSMHCHLSFNSMSKYLP